MKKGTRFSRTLKFLKGNPRFTIGLIFILVVLVMTMFPFLFTSHDPLYRYDAYHEPPSSEHILGTTRLGRDVFAQTLYGGRQSLIVGLLAATITTLLSMVVGISAGYIGGKYDSVVSMITNVVMVIPNIVLLLIVASMMEDGVSPLLISLIIGFTSWPWNSRVLRAQTMSIRNRDFVRSAETLGENKFRILFFEIMPNMLSIISSAFVGTLIYSIMAHATLEFIGFGDPLSVTWGTILYNARNTGAFQSGYFFEVVGAIIGLVLVGMGLTLVNYAIDEVSNPKLKAQKMMKSYYKARKIELKRIKKDKSVSQGAK